MWIDPEAIDKYEKWLEQGIRSHLDGWETESAWVDRLQYRSMAAALTEALLKLQELLLPEDERQ